MIGVSGNGTSLTLYDCDTVRVRYGVWQSEIYTISAAGIADSDTLTGGIITGGRAYNAYNDYSSAFGGGGVDAYKADSTVSPGNTASSQKTANNLYLSSEFLNSKTVALGAMSSGASIGVLIAKAPSKDAPVTFTSAAGADYQAYFTSDYNHYVIQKKSDNAVQLALAPAAAPVITYQTADKELQLNWISTEFLQIMATSPDNDTISA